MKKLILSISLLCGFSFVFSQNMNDNKITFTYVQLPMIQIDDQFDKYEVRIEHDYKQANEDSVALNELRQEAALTMYKQLSIHYKTQRDSLDRIYLGKLSTWEKSVNSGITNENGTPLTKPIPPMYPEAPMYPIQKTPLFHTDYEDTKITSVINLEGYEKGLGGFLVTISLHPIQHGSIIMEKSGTGSATKYKYKSPYTLPITVKIESPTQGVLIEQRMYDTQRFYKMKDQKSQYDHPLYMMDNKEAFYLQVEDYARKQGINSLNDYINGQIGFVNKKRTVEIYTVKKFKSYNYNDVDFAFKKTVTALQAVKNDDDRSGAMDLIDEALEALNEILLESNDYDKKARINDKITAMLECNKMELLMWQAEFDEVDALISLLINSGEGKAKRHSRGQQGFYADQRLRWEANY